MATLFRKPASWLLTIGAAAVIAFCFLILPTYRLYLIHSGSMTPTIPVGSAVVVEKGSVHVGQVVTFHRLGDGALVTHRLIAVRPDGTLVTKGDGDTSPDLGSIPLSNVIGHVVAAPQHVGTTIEFMFHSPSGYAFDGLVLLALTLALSYKPARKRSAKSARE